MHLSSRGFNFAVADKRTFRGDLKFAVAPCTVVFYYSHRKMFASRADPIQMRGWALTTGVKQLHWSNIYSAV